MNTMGTVDSVFFQSGFSVTLEPGEMLVMFHRVYTWALLLWWLTILGSILGLAKTDLCPGKPLNPRQTGTAGHPTVSSQRSSHCGRGKRGLCLEAGPLYLPGVAGNFTLWPNTAIQLPLLTIRTIGSLGVSSAVFGGCHKRSKKQNSNILIISTRLIKLSPQRRWENKYLALGVDRMNVIAFNF